MTQRGYFTAGSYPQITTLSSKKSKNKVSLKETEQMCWPYVLITRFVVAHAEAIKPTT